MFTQNERTTLRRLMKVDVSTRNEFTLLLDAIEADATETTTIAEVQRLMGLVVEQESQIQKSTTKQAGLVQADVAGFSQHRLCDIRAGRYENLREIARLIGWPFVTRAAGAF